MEKIDILKYFTKKNSMDDIRYNVIKNKKMEKEEYD